MPKKVALTALNARSIDIVNVIRQNASSTYQATIPEITNVHELPAVGEALAGAPALQNEFLNALINRIALVRVNSATFNNAYKELKKGMLEYGETVEEVFVQITKARPFNVENAPAQEFKRSMPDVRSAFHVRNWRVQYPVTIQDDDLRTAFLSSEGVTDLIARIVDAVYTAAEYDEFLLFKYLLIKAVNKGKVYFDFTTTTINESAESVGKKLAVKFRGLSNKLTFMSSEYNEAHVKTATKKEDQYIFMDSMFNASFDVDVLAGAFNMDKTEFMGHLKLVDDWTTFDNERFDEIREFSDALEEVTDDELSAMSTVKAILVDKEWFQIYDNLTKFTEKYVAGGLYWNYFYHIWKTISTSPFSNVICFKTGMGSSAPAAIDGVVDGVSKADNGQTCITMHFNDDANNAPIEGVKLVQTSSAGDAFVGVQEYGALIFNSEDGVTDFTLDAKYMGADYSCSITGADLPDTAVGDSFDFTKVN